jgi:hypothetical protein
MDDTWPSLPLNRWKDTADTLHLYTQIVGKIRLALAPIEREWANVPLYVTARGLTTTAIPYGERAFAIDFDLIAHVVDIVVSDGQRRSIPLLPAPSVADFYHRMMEALAELRIAIRIWPVPSEIPEPIRFTEDTQHASYDADYANRFWRVLLQVDMILKEHRAPFRGRHTPVQFFWGSFDLAYARFSGRPATPPSDDIIMRVAMDAQEICAGFWPGDARFPEPAFWCYAFPKPAFLEASAIAPSAAYWNAGLGEFVLRYEDVRASDAPREMLRQFFASTFDACAALAKWNEVAEGEGRRA